MIGSYYNPAGFMNSRYAEDRITKDPNPNAALTLHTASLITAEEAWANELQRRWNALYKQFKADIDSMIVAAGGEEFIAVNSFGPTYRDLVLEVACPPTNKLQITDNAEDPDKCCGNFGECDGCDQPANDRIEDCCDNPADCVFCPLAEADVAALDDKSISYAPQTLLEKLVLDMQNNTFKYPVL